VSGRPADLRRERVDGEISSAAQESGDGPANGELGRALRETGEEEFLQQLQRSRRAGLEHPLGEPAHGRAQASSAGTVRSVSSCAEKGTNALTPPGRNRTPSVSTRPDGASQTGPGVTPRRKLTGCSALPRSGSKRRYGEAR